MTTIAFTSCMLTKRPIHKGWQNEAWGEVRGHAPDHLCLLGDNIYMDFGAGTLQSKQWSVAVFAREMHARYARQWNDVEAFRDLVRSTSHVHVIWDDHDFAWKNSRGAGQDPVSTEKQRVSKFLYQQFQQHLNQNTGDQGPTTYPNLPGLPEMLATSLAKVFNSSMTRVAFGYWPLMAARFGKILVPITRT